MTAGLTPVFVAALQAAAPLLVLLWAARSGRGAPRRLSLGRFLLLYALLFVAQLYVGRWFDQVGALVLLSLVLGAMGAGLGVGALYRLLYGTQWLSAHPEDPRRDVLAWQLPVSVASVACMALALALAYLPGVTGGPQ